MKFVLLFSFFILFLSCGNGGKKITYWKDNKNTIIVESKDHFYIYFKGYWKNITFNKLSNTTKGNAILISGDFEYNIYFNLPFDDQRSKVFKKIDYLKKSNQLVLKNYENNKNYKFDEYPNLIQWDSLVFENYYNKKLFKKITIFPQNNMEVDVFCTFLFLGIDNHYSPESSSDILNKLKLYLTNRTIIKENTTILPQAFSKILYKEKFKS